MAETVIICLIDTILLFTTVEKVRQAAERKRSNICLKY